MEYIFTTLLLVIIAVLTALHFWIHKCRCGSFVNKIPGPEPRPLLGNLLEVVTSPEGLWDFFRTSADIYYPIYKFWILHWPVVNIRHPDDVEVLLNNQKNISKSIFYDFLHPWLNDGLLTSTGNKWRHRRKTLTPAFHFNALQEFVSVFDENSKRLVDTLKKESGEVIEDLISFLAKFTLAVICESAMGTFLEDDDSVQEQYRRSVKRMGEIVFYRSVRPWLRNDWIFSLTRVGREHTRVLKILHGFTDRIIKSRKKYHDETGGKYLKVFSSDAEETALGNVPSYDIPLKKKRLAMLDLLIAAQRAGDDIDDLGIREEVDTFIFEGHDTTVVALSFTLLLLAEHKDIQERARAEFDSLLKETDGKLGIKEAQNLPYLERCIKESLRMFPSVPSISRHTTHDLHLKKYTVPRGAFANLHIFDVHRDPKFWPEPHVYDPDRFLPDQVQSRHPFAYVPFSGGARNCIGQKFAMLELKFFVGRMLHSFYLEPMIQVSKVRFVTDLVLNLSNALSVKFIPIL